MPKKGISQEGLKLIACVSMLIDHIGAVLVIPGEAVMEPSYAAVAWANVVMRGIGRIAFPIFCFLLVEGAAHTRSSRKYALRLAAGMMLSELPFDLAFYGRINWAHQNVMVTLLLGFGMLEAMKRTKSFWKLLWIIPFYMAAEWMHTDYAGNGILLIAMFALVKDAKHEKWIRLLGMALLFWDNMGVYYWNLSVPIYYNRLRLMSALPIFFYDGRKLTRNRAVQWAFYLFYPVHITILWIVKVMLSG